MIKLMTCLMTFYLTSQLAVPNVYAISRPDLGGTIQIEVKGLKVDLPVLKTDLKADIQGDSAMVTIVQSFINPTNTPLHATYLFPLNKDAAVYAMQMEVGDEIVEAKSRKRKKPKRRGKQPPCWYSIVQTCLPRILPI